jgi:hypothetical protein
MTCLLYNIFSDFHQKRLSNIFNSCIHCYYYVKFTIDFLVLCKLLPNVHSVIFNKRGLIKAMKVST